MMDFALMMMDFVLKLMDFVARRWRRCFRKANWNFD